MRYRVKITKTKYTYTTSSSRMKKNPSLANVSSEIRRSPRLKQNTPLQKQEKKVSAYLRSSKKCGQNTGSNAFVLKKYVLNAGAKEKKYAVATQPVTHESSRKKRSSEKARQKTGSKAFVSKLIGLIADGKENFKESSDNESAVATQPLNHVSSMKTRSSKKARDRPISKAFVGKNIGLNADRKENFEDSSDDESAVATQPVTQKSSRKIRSSKKAEQPTGSKAFVSKNIGLDADRKENFKDYSDDESVVATQPVTHEYSRKIRSPKKTYSKAFVGKNIELDANGTENFIDSSDDESVVGTQPLTREPPIKKINSNVTYSESLLPKRFQSHSIKDSMKENPSQKIGRRSGAAAFAGKIIRLLPDGTENFADYWTDTESSSTGDSSCGSPANKNNTTYNNSFSIVPESQQSQTMNESFCSVPESQLSLKMNDSITSVPESRQSPKKKVSFSFSSVARSQQSPKKKTTPIKYMWKNSLLKTGSAPPKIGRRTGSAAFVGKTIRLLPDGTENFEDYWTDETSSEDSDEPEALDFSKEILNNTSNASKNAGVVDSSPVSTQNQKETSVFHSKNHEPFSSEPSLSKSPNTINAHTISEKSLNEDILKSFEEEKVIGDRSENVSLQDSPDVTSQNSFKEKDLCVASDRSENVLPQDSPSVSSGDSEANLLKLSPQNSFKYKLRRIPRSSRKRSLEHVEVVSPDENEIAPTRSTKSLYTDSEVSRSSKRNNESLEDGAEESGYEFENIARDSGKELNDVAKDLSKEFEDIARDSGKEFETVARDSGKEFEKAVSDSRNEFEDIVRDSGNEFDDFRVNEISSTRDGCVIKKAAATEILNSPNAKRKNCVLENDTEDILQGNKTVPEGNVPRGPKSKKRKRNKIPQEPFRRSTRESVPPLAFWHGERRKHRIICGEFIYLGIDSGWKKDEGAFSALAKQIQLRNKKIKKLKKTKKRAPQKSTVVNPHTNEFVNVELHKPFSSVDWSSIKGDDLPKVPYYLTKTFMSEKMSFGFLDLCPLQVKGSQYSPDDNIHFVVQKGHVKVNICNTAFEFEKYDSFIVPNMEMYSIENLRDSHALLSFTTFKIPFFPYQCNECTNLFNCFK